MYCCSITLNLSNYTRAGVYNSLGNIHYEKINTSNQAAENGDDQLKEKPNTSSTVFQKMALYTANSIQMGCHRLSTS